MRSFSFPVVSPAGRGLWVAAGTTLVALTAIGLMAGRPLISAGFSGQDFPAAGSRAFRRDVPAAVHAVTVAMSDNLADAPERGVASPRIPDTRIIRTGSATLRADSMAVVLARADSIAARLGGYVTASDESGSDAGLIGGTLTLRVPSANFDRLVNGIERLGRLDRLHIETQDVGEEYVDIEAQLSNGRRLESRLIGLLATRTGKLADVLEAERELARVRENIDALVGRQRYLDRSLAMSTLTLQVVPAATTAIAEPGIFRAAARDAWTSFVWLLAFGVRVSGVVVPLLLLASGAWWVARRRATAA